MARIRQDDVEAVKERTELVQLVSQYLTLKRTGSDSMSGLCPFHQEKTPSFSVSPSKQVFYCFGCGKGGDAISFLRELEHLTYVEALERLAHEAGIQLRYEGDSPAERRKAERRAALIRANEEASALFSRMLAEGREGADARAYLAERGVSESSIATFGIGYAPGYPDFLLRRLAQRLSPEILLDAGLVTRGEDGTVRDRFRGRITFPIRDMQGRAIGFGARILPSDQRAGEQAKYLNTAETPIYRKHEVLYNLDHARNQIARTGEVYVVEGYTDVIGLAQAGLENVVATCGTALGERHVELLSRFAQRAVLAFDSDEAGARAAERAFEFHERFPVQAVVMIMPDGLDPADLVAKRGIEAVREAAAGARPLVEYMVRRVVARHDPSTVEGRSAAVADALPIVRGLRDPVRRSEYVHLLADLAGVSEAGVQQALGRPQGADAGKPVRRSSARDRVEREMLRLVTRDAAIFASFSGRVTDDHVHSVSLRRALNALREAGGDVTTVAGGDDQTLASSVSALAVEPLEGEGSIEYAGHVFDRLDEFRLKDRSDALHVELQRLNPTTDPDYDALFRELAAVDGDLRRLRQVLRAN
jgi:DNA primase